MNILKQKIKFLNSTLDYVPKRIQKLYIFGFNTFSFQEIKSLRSNSRLSNDNWNTAKSKAYRITANKNIHKIFPKLLINLNIVNEKDIIAVDFSDFKGFQVLMFAKQTKKGRAIPVYFEILTYPIQKNSQNIFIIKSIDNFTSIIGFKTKLVFDRGFACPSIIQYLCDKNHKFIIRIKKDKKIHKNTKAKNLKENDLKVFAYKRKIRVITSDNLKDMKEPWYLITNDFKSKKETIIKQYYYRFEIEEFFRDAKRLLGLEYIKFKKSKSLSIILWFVILGTWFVWKLKETKQDKIQRKKFQLSRVRYFFEKMNIEIFRMIESQLLTES